MRPSRRPTERAARPRRLAAVSVAAFAVTFGVACGGRAVSGPVPVPAALPGTAPPRATKEPSPASACREPTRDATPDAVSKLAPAWRWTRDDGEGAPIASLVRAGNLLLVEHADGAWATADAETGVRCNGTPRGPTFLQRPTPTPELVVGLDATGIVAVAPRSLVVKWSVPLAPLLASSPRDRAEGVRERVRLRVASGVVFAVLPLQRTLANGYRWEVVGVGLDAATGRELWKKVVVTADVNEPWSPEADLRIHDDGTRLVVEARGSLRALEPRTGKPRWTAPLPGARELARDRRVFVRGDRVVLAPRDEPAVLRDTTTGAVVKGFDVRGRVTDAAAVDAGLVLVTESRPGVAELVRVDGSGGVKWRQPVERSVSRLRAFADVVHTFEGSGRLVLRDAATGAARGSLSIGGASSLELVKTSAGTRAVVVDGGDVVAFDLPRDPKPSPLPPFLAWTFAPSRPGEFLAAAVAWVDGDDKLVWSRPVPPHVQDGIGRLAWNDVVAHASRPRFVPLLQGRLGIVDSDEAIAVGHPEGVWVLRRKDGTTALDFAAGRPIHKVFFDDGTYELGGASPCHGRARGAKVFAMCGPELLWFDGTRAALIDGATWQLRGEAVVGQPPTNLGRGAVQAEVQLAGRSLRLEGRVQLY